MTPTPFQRLLEAMLPPRPPRSNRLVVATQPAAIYAIGDIHGCIDLLEELEAMIVADAAAFEGECWILSLGDGVDRGPATAQVIDHLRDPSPGGLRRLNLMGNHEAMMLDFIDHPRGDSTWITSNGGAPALMSYGVPAEKLIGMTNREAERLVQSHIPSEHVAYMRALPVLVETPGALFVHAGLRPGTALAAQSDEDLLWYRDEYRNDFAEFGKVVVHGHTPRDTPLVTPHRIAVDTGAVLTGQLTAVRITPTGPPALFSTPRRPMPGRRAPP